MSAEQDSLNEDKDPKDRLIEALVKRSERDSKLIAFLAAKLHKSGML